MDENAPEGSSGHLVAPISISGNATLVFVLDRETGKIITFEPMNPRDRRVVHLALAKFEGVITKSDGEGDDRRVQIIPVRR